MKKLIFGVLLVVGGLYTFANFTEIESAIKEKAGSAQGASESLAGKASKAVNDKLNEVTKPATEAYSGIVNKTDKHITDHVEKD